MHCGVQHMDVRLESFINLFFLAVIVLLIRCFIITAIILDHIDIITCFSCLVVAAAAQICLHETRPSTAAPIVSAFVLPRIHLPQPPRANHSVAPFPESCWQDIASVHSWCSDVPKVSSSIPVYAYERVYQLQYLYLYIWACLSCSTLEIGSLVVDD